MEYIDRKKPITAALLYFREVPGLGVDGGVIGEWEVERRDQKLVNPIYRIYLMSNDVDKVREAMTHLVKSIQGWLDDPRNAGSETKAPKAVSIAREGERLFPDMEMDVCPNCGQPAPKGTF